MFKQQYNGDQIRKAILLYEKLKSFRKVAAILKISKSSIHRWYNRFHKVLSPTNRKYNKRKRRYKFETLIDDLRVIFQTDKLKFITLEQIRRLLDYEPSLSTIAKMLKRAKISRRRFTNHVRIRGLDQET